MAMESRSPNIQVLAFLLFLHQVKNSATIDLQRKRFVLLGYSLNVILETGVLQITVGTPASDVNTTRGLLGVYNGNPDDDLTAPDGSVVDSASSERTIYYEFGEKCKFISHNLETKLSCLLFSQ
jgi:hypothetical protein